MKSIKKELRVIGISQCMEEVVIEGVTPDPLYFCVLKLGHKSHHRIIIADKAVEAIKLDNKRLDKKFKSLNKLCKKLEAKTKKRYKEDLPQHYKW